MPNARSDVAFAHGAVPLLPEWDEPRPAGAQRLLEAAVVSFAERGYHGVSVRELAAAAGVKAASVYAHFPSKEALLADLVVHGHRTHHATVREAILGAGADPRDQLREGVRANMRFHGTYPLLAMVCNADLHALSPDHQTEVIAIRTATGVLLGSVVEHGNAMGAFDCDQPSLALSAIGGMAIHMATWYRDPSQRIGDSPLDRYVSAVLQGLDDGDDDLEIIASGYADYALRIVDARRDDPSSAG